MKTTNDDCVHTWVNKKNGRAGTNISKVSQPPAGPRFQFNRNIPSVIDKQTPFNRDMLQHTTYKFQ